MELFIISQQAQNIAATLRQCYNVALILRVCWDVRQREKLIVFHIFQTIVDESAEDNARKSSLETTRKGDSKPDVVINMPVLELHSVGGVLVHMPHVRFSINKN